MNRVRKAVFPVAGLGSRFLPATKASPKEMMPIVDKPLIQFAVEEAVAAGATDLIFITGRTKRAIEDHFDKAYEIEAELQRRGKMELLKSIQEIIPRHVNCIYIRQSEPLGLGHAVLCARPAVQNEPFAVILADDLIQAERSALLQMVDVFERVQCSVLGVEDVPRDQTGSYGIVRAKNLEGSLVHVTGLVEKPSPADAPSTLAVVGRYILTPRIFDFLARQEPGKGGEIQLTDAIAALMSEQDVRALRFKGTRYDCGSKAGFLQATVDYGLRHPETSAVFANWLQHLSGRKEHS
jgi:UTP--glucose-1-phosphate uridylyltransferase